MAFYVMRSNVILCFVVSLRNRIFSHLISLICCIRVRSPRAMTRTRTTRTSRRRRRASGSGASPGDARARLRARGRGGSLRCTGACESGDLPQPCFGGGQRQSTSSVIFPTLHGNIFFYAFDFSQNRKEDVFRAVRSTSVRAKSMMRAA